MKEIFDDFIWTKQKKIITRNKHQIASLGNISHFSTNTASPPAPMHYHSDIIEIHCVLKGNFSTFIEKTGRITEYEITGNQVFFTYPFELHGNGNEPVAPCEFYAFQIAIDSPSHMLGLNAEYSKMLVRQLMQLPNRQLQLEPASMNLFRNAFAYFSQLTSDSNTIGCQFLNCFLFELQFLKPITHKTVQQTDERIRIAIQYLTQNVRENLQLTDLADAAGYSLSHFKIKFREEIGITPAEYITMQKIDLAKQLLVGSDAPITDVAYSLGFSSSNYFCTVFKKIMNCTPSVFRQHHGHTYK